MPLLSATPVTTLEDHLATGGGEGLTNAVAMTPDEVIEEVSESGLRGRGGAGFPTGMKWRSIRDAAEGSRAYLVCNAAEGEPGTYKDRVLMAHNPFALVEGILIGVHALQAEGAVIGIKAGYREQLERIEAALDAADRAGWSGADRVTVVAGPDEYLFGEESALIEVIEGKQPMPRILPPYMQGLFATMAQPNPTAVNNVETLMHVGHLMRDGANAWRSTGTDQSPGTMVFTVIGDCATPGVFELPMGTPMRTLICDLAGAEDPSLIISGVSNTVISPDLLDLPLDFDSFAEAGTGLGSGGFVVYGQAVDPVGVAATLAEFLAIESCGQCNACQLGTADMADHLHRLDRGEGSSSDIDAIRTRLVTVTDANRCYLPVGAQLTIGSLLQDHADAFGAAVTGGPRTPTAVPTPKIVRIADGTVDLDASYHRKRRDWSYGAEEG